MTVSPSASDSFQTSIQPQPNKTMPPRKTKVLIEWAVVLKLCSLASVGESTARNMFWRPDSPARKVLRGMKRARYVRAVVLRELGLTESDLQPEGKSTP